ncbi:MAG: fructose-bisphosphatase class III [Candidatus Omnitrophica bacterium]|nr:fructose-bisphosphatase class III [Candidatus Omnitrophota bacterium]
MIKRIFVLSDIHGCYNELEQLLSKVNFDNEKDKLICLGDVCDRGSHVKECIDRLMQMKNLIYIMGNHDLWTLQFLNKTINRFDEQGWWRQGGRETMESLGGDTTIYKKFLFNAKPYYIDEENRCFVHGGFDIDFPIETQSIESLVWGRELWREAQHAKIMNEKHGHKDTISSYKEIFIGHTPTQHIDNKDIPINYLNLWCIDTGKIYGGKLTIMNVDTKEYWQV